jgi:hypothetical protein
MVADNFNAVPFETLYSNVAQDIFDKDLPAGHKRIIPAKILCNGQLEAENNCQADHANSRHRCDPLTSLNTSRRI